MFARLVYFAAAVVLMMSNPAHAQSTRYGTYYDETIVIDCPSGPGCAAVFSQLPSDKLTLVHHVSCNIISYAPTRMATLRISTTASAANAMTRVMPMQLGPTVASNGTYTTNINLNTDYLVGPSRFPFVDVTDTQAGDILMQCTLEGALIDPIP
ncbi:hypothetical protein JQ612_00690 [Bradyrhizobium manausense]|uniref:hypothetical protein n=1 Tax=Bradyrhizobium manausense TaxID=989370 RepID=UPI001BAB91EE|nr:hypothetical protein [Bradyrhizobium manausense]MBR0831691.1 hypothetical protein [Bradyrhizobium manausense]